MDVAQPWPLLEYLGRILRERPTLLSPDVLKVIIVSLLTWSTDSVDIGGTAKFVDVADASVPVLQHWSTSS